MYCPTCEKTVEKENITIVEIDEASLDKHGQWPWDRNIIGRGIEKAFKNGAQLVVLPILFAEKDRLGGDEFLVVFDQCSIEQAVHAWDRIIERFESSVDNARDCDLLARTIQEQVCRRISSTTLRRFFGLLNSETSLSGFNLDTLSIYCGCRDYKDFS